MTCVCSPRLLATGVNKLMVAACTGDSDSIRSLVNEEGFSPSHEFQQGVTALHEACEGGHEECVAVLIELGAEVNKQVITCILLLVVYRKLTTK